MTRSLNAVEGVREALGQQSIENQPALILEYIEGETLRDHIGRKTLSLRAKLEIAVLIGLSSVSSATAFFRRAFSLSSSLRRLARETFIPP